MNALATGRSDVGAHLDARQREALHASGVKLVVTGIAMIVLGIVVVAAMPEFVKALGISIGGVALASLGYTRMRAAR